MARVKSDACRLAIPSVLRADEVPEGHMRVSQEKFLEICADLAPTVDLGLVL